MRIIVAVVAATALYLGTSNVLLYRALRGLGNTETTVDWSSAYTLFPGSVRVHDLRLTRQAAPRGELRAGRAHLELGAFALLRGERHVRHAKIHATRIALGEYSMDGVIELDVSGASFGPDGWRAARALADVTGTLRGAGATPIRVTDGEVRLEDGYGRFSELPSRGLVEVNAALRPGAAWIATDRAFDLSGHLQFVDGALEPGSEANLRSSGALSVSAPSFELSLPTGVELSARQTPARTLEVRLAVPGGQLELSSLEIQTELRGDVTVSGALLGHDPWKIESGLWELTSLRLGAGEAREPPSTGSLTLRSGVIRRARVESVAARLHVSGPRLEALLQWIDAPETVRWMLGGRQDEPFDFRARLEIGTKTLTLDELHATAGDLTMKGFLRRHSSELEGGLLLLRTKPLLGILLEDGTTDVVWRADEEWIRQQSARLMVAPAQISKHP